jgi:hypothetical protein
MANGNGNGRRKGRKRLVLIGLGVLALAVVGLVAARSGGKELDPSRIAKVEKGDMVCLYTGFADVLLEMEKKPDPKLVNETCTGLNGRDAKLLQWISDSGLACLLADNYAVELIATSITEPLPKAQPWLPLHEHCLFKNGIHLGEMFYFTELARWLKTAYADRYQVPPNYASFKMARA